MKKNLDLLLGLSFTEVLLHCWLHLLEAACKFCFTRMTCPCTSAVTWPSYANN